MHVIICGGRKYDLTLGDWDWLDTLGITHVRHGDATGADTGAKAWAEHRGIPHQPYKVTPQDWQEKGPAAGPLRNVEMCRDLVVDMAFGIPTAVIAFPGGKGTADMCSKAKKAGIRVIHYHEDRILLSDQPAGFAQEPSAVKSAEQAMDALRVLCAPYYDGVDPLKDREE